MSSEQQSPRLVQIAPSILSADFARLGEEVLAVIAGGADLIHVDVMDGHFVPNLTIGLPVIRSLKRICDSPLDVHLMIRNAESSLEQYIEAGADLLLVHQEACTHLHRALSRIRELGVQAGAVLNPATPVDTLRPVLGLLDVVLVMTVNPGFGGQAFIESSLAKLRRLRAMCAAEGVSPRIQVDGGVTPENIAAISRAGADRFVAGSAIFRSGDYAATIATLRERAQAAQR